MDQSTFADPRSWPRAGSGILGQETEDPPGAVLGADGRPDSLAAAAGTHPSFYPKVGKGRRPYPLAVMLRIHCVQLFYNLSDPGMEDPRFREGRLCSTRPSRSGGSWV